MQKEIRTATGQDRYYSHVLTTSELKQHGGNGFELVPDADDRRLIASQTDATELRKIRFTGTIQPVGKTDWRLVAKLGATVVQACVVSLIPVTTRVDVPVQRYFTKRPDGAPGAETEFDGDDVTEPLESVIDLGQILIEALTLAMPEYPRAGDAELAQSAFSAPGIKPLSDSDLKPFAALAQLKDRLAD